MLIFKMNRSDEPNITYIHVAKENDARYYGSYEKIIDRDFTYINRTGVKYSVSVIKDTSGKWRYIKSGEIEMNQANMWVIESVIKFGKIMSPQDVTKMYAERLSSL